MSALDGWIDVCRTGAWRDMNGREVRLDAPRLDRIVAAYGRADPAPVVVGHPATDAPAYGWVEGLRRVGDRLQAKLGQIAPAFRRAVESGQYSGRSIALQGDTVRHVGFLGGTAPAVPGLAPTRFAAPAETVAVFAAAALAPGSEDPARRARLDARAASLDRREAALAKREAALAADGGTDRLYSSVIADEARALMAGQAACGVIVTAAEAVDRVRARFGLPAGPGAAG